MVRDHAIGKIGVELRNRSEDSRAAIWMRVYRTTLRRRELGFFVDDVEQRRVDFSDVVKECDAFNASTLSFVEPSLFGEDQ